MKRIADSIEYVFHAIFGLTCLLLLHLVCMIFSCFGISIYSKPHAACAVEHKPHQLADESRLSDDGAST